MHRGEEGESRRYLIEKKKNGNRGYTLIRSSQLGAQFGTYTVVSVHKKDTC